MAAKTSTTSGRKPAAKAPGKSATARKSAKAKTVSKAAAPGVSTKPESKVAAKPKTKAAAELLPKTGLAKPSLSVVKDAATPTSGLELKKRELLDEVVKRTDVKKKFAKPVVEAMIDVLGEALAAERTLNLQPLGRIMPKRTKDTGSNRVITARIRQSKNAAKATANTPAGNKSRPARIAEDTPVAKPAE
ncbi:MAG: HU family DNA-binding protein [Pseudomonadota bacterium]